MSADSPDRDLWLYDPRQESRHFHLLVEKREVKGWNWQQMGWARAACSRIPRRRFVTCLEPPEHLELCDECALADYKAWVVYACYSADGQCLYVGSTKDLPSRMRSHRSCRQRSSRWMPALSRIQILGTHTNSHVAGAHERDAIAQLAPKFNTRHRMAEVAA